MTFEEWWAKYYPNHDTGVTEMLRQAFSAGSDSRDDEVAALLRDEIGGQTTIRFWVEWAGEVAAGIRSGSEEVTIVFKYGQPLDEDTLDFWKQAVAEFYDGATVTLLADRK